MSGKELLNFDKTYKSLVKSICSNELEKVKSLYEEWLNAREECKPLIFDFVKRGELSKVELLDKVVAYSFESLNGSEKELLKYYPLYQTALSDASEELCSKDIISRIVEASSFKLSILPGISLDLKKLLAGGS
mgnify:CR=1 FL=1